MNGITINIDPVILRLGGFELRWYSLMIILAVVAAVLIGARQFKKKGIASDTIFSMLPWVLIGGLIGARLFHVVDRWEYYAANPLQIFQLQQGGLAIYGAMAGGIVAAAIFGKRRHLELGIMADAMVPALLVAQIIGRFGCIINGDAYGSVTSLPWGFIYLHPDASIPGNLAGVPTHPYPVYEQLWNLLTLAVLIRMGRYFKKDGLLFFSYLAFYSVGRFILTFVRQEKIWFGGMQEAQVLAIGILITAVAMLLYLSRKAKREVVVQN